MSIDYWHFKESLGEDAADARYAISPFDATASLPFTTPLLYQPTISAQARFFMPIEPFRLPAIRSGCFTRRDYLSATLPAIASV